MITSPPLVVFDVCRRCGNAVVQRQPAIATECRLCGGEWREARRASNADWTTRLIVRRLRRLRDAAAQTASGRWWGLDAAGLAFCERVRVAACGDRWHRCTVIYALATALISATTSAAAARKTRSATAHNTHRHRAVKNLDLFASTCRAAGV